ncbi:MAG: 4-hydroxythreonine-4-phosphate dehydrogenase [Spirosoma sp.]|nr:4-hydroxythreonine-4-phosphate dehydrogenase [Spirosoma sp.]
MEQRQPDELNQPLSDPLPKQPSNNEGTNGQSATQQPLVGDQQGNPRGDASQHPNNRHQRQPNGRHRGNRPERTDGSGEASSQPREHEPRSRPESEGQTADQRNPRQRDAAQHNAGQRDNAQRDAGRRSNRNDGRPNARDRGGDARERYLAERDTESQPRDDRFPIPGGDPNGQTGQATDSPGSDDRLVIGISLGDYNGIGPEVVLKALQYNRLQKLCTPVIYGSMRILNRYRNLLDLKDWNLNGAPTVGQISHKLTNVITCWPDQSQDIQPGQVTPEAGQAALACLQRAVDDLKDGKIDALVTAPINKYNIQSEEFQFPGHTEYLAQQFNVADNLMFMVSDILRVGVVTGHVPLGSVRQYVTRERIARKLSLMMQSLKQDFGIEKPKIAVLGLNPHAGEEGLLGNEEQDIIKPLLTDLRNKGQLVFGPYPADGFFGTRNYRNFDAVLAMYHDQGLIPFKAIAFEEGVNFTAGMPFVRTSPDHGTAYDIAGKNLADETSMLQAIYTAIDVARQRKESMELDAGALRKQSVPK